MRRNWRCDVLAFGVPFKSPCEQILRCPGGGNSPSRNEGDINPTENERTTAAVEDSGTSIRHLGGHGRSSLVAHRGLDAGRSKGNRARWNCLLVPHDDTLHFNPEVDNVEGGANRPREQNAGTGVPRARGGSGPVGPRVPHHGSQSGSRASIGCARRQTGGETLPGSFSVRHLRSCL